MMPHLKCTACRIRVRCPQSPLGGVGELCPGCGSLLQPVRNLSELVGLQAAPSAADAGSEPSGASRWLDDGGSVALDVAVAVALPLPGEQ